MMNHDWSLRHPDDDGETLHLRNLGPQRSYGTCSSGDGSAFGSSLYSHRSSPIGRISRECLTHTVSSSETLAGIALKYDLTIEDIRRYNSLWQNDNVWPGQKLRIPVTTASPTGLEVSSVSSSELSLSAMTKDETKKSVSQSPRKGSNPRQMIC